MELFHRCESRNALPRAGGVEDQDSWTMGAFDVLTVELSHIRKAIWEEEDFNRK